MKREVHLDIADKELERAVELILGYQGYTCSDSKDIPTVTDHIGAFSKNVLRVCREGSADEKNVLLRPFEEYDLVLAVDALFDSAETEQKKGALKIDKRRMTVTADGLTVSLTEKEMQLFLLLMQSKGEAVSDAEIEEKVFGEVADGSNIAAVYVNYLRKKLDQRLGKNLIFRIRGKGYALKIT